MEHINVEKFFLNTLLKVSIAGILLILISDAFVYPEDTLSIGIDAVVLATCSICYLIRISHPTISVLILTSVVLLAMTYQCFAVPISTTNSLSIILLVGFIHSVMLKGKKLWIMQTVTLVLVCSIFILQATIPGLQYMESRSEMATVVITYSIIFFILTYATRMLKSSYDKIYAHLNQTNTELHQKATEIEAQNEELVQVQAKLNSVNTNLEKIVEERTAKVHAQNEILRKYSYTNAHHLRGPVARLLGLANVYKLEVNPDPDFIITKMVDQANEIDSVIKQINVDLETHE